MTSETATPNRYGAALIILHWLTFLWLVAVYTLIELHEYFPKGSAMRDGLKHWHFMMGLCILLLLAARVVARRRSPVPPIVPPLPGWQRLSALSMHAILYLFLLVMPVLGWLTLSAKGQVIPFFGLELPALIGKDKPLARNLQDIHETIGNIGFYLIGLHILAALFHHYVTRDNVLRRMWLRQS